MEKDTHQGTPLDIPSFRASSGVFSYVDSYSLYFMAWTHVQNSRSDHRFNVVIVELTKVLFG